MRRTSLIGVLLVAALAGCNLPAMPAAAPTPAPTPTSTPSATPTATPTASTGALATPTPKDAQDLPNLDLPPGESLVYSGRYGIYTLARAVGQPGTLVENADNHHYDSPSWSPAGDRLIYSVNEPQGARIYTVNADGKGITELRNKITFGYPAWSPDGIHIAYTTNLGLYITNTAGRDQQLVLRNPSLVFPAWSPDGKQLAMLGNPGDLSNFGNYYGPDQIYLVDSDGQNFHAITAPIAGAGHLSWSPDGTRIAFRSHDECGDIEVLDLVSGTITNLTNSPGVVEQDPAWSPDGNFIAFSKAAYAPCQQDHVYFYQGSLLYLMTADGHNVTPLVNAKGDQPAWWPTILLQQGWKYSVTHAAEPLGVREGPGLLALALTDLPAGGVFTVLDGPRQLGGADWWYIRTEEGIEGWVQDVPGWYMLASPSDAHP